MMKVCILFLSMMFLLAPAGKAQPKIWDETEGFRWKIMKSISTCSSRICIIRVSGPGWRRLRV